MREPDFSEADRRYAELKRRHELGGLSAEEFDEQLRELMVRDEEGRWWAKSRRTGEWHYNDGTDWRRGTPPGYRSSTTAGAAAHQGGSRQQVESPSGGFLEWHVPVRFSYGVLVSVLLGVLWVAIQLVVMTSNTVQTSDFVDLLQAFSLYFSPGFVLALGAERAYLALVRSVLITLLGFVVYTWPIELALEIRLYQNLLAQNISPDAWSSLLSPNSDEVTSFFQAVVVLAVVSGVVGWVGFHTTNLRYTSLRTALLGVGVSLAASITWILLS